MKAKTPTPKVPKIPLAPVPQAPMPKKSFLQRFGVIVAVVALFAVLIATAAFVFTRVTPKKTVQVPISSAPSLANLPGLRSQLSERSRYQIQALAAANPHVVAIVAIRYKYGKNESPYIFSWTREKGKAVVEKIIADTEARQASSQGMTSAEARELAMKDPKKAADQLRNSEEAKLGLVKCIPITEAAVTNPELVTIATGICYATIPPFDPNTAMAIIVLTDSDLAQYSEVTEMRRLLLTLQIDIFNRDFQGRETWVHP